MSAVDSVTTLFKNLLGTSNEVALRKLRPIIVQVRALEAALVGLDDTAMRKRSADLKMKVAGKDLTDADRAEALAMAREAADRRIGMFNALDPARGFPDDAWGEAKPAVDEARAKLAATDAEGKPMVMPWDIDLPASYYAAVRRLYPVSAPPFRMRAFDVQILGASVLLHGKIAEMKTGEGKTLVASLAAYAHSLTGKSLHVITVNDYLASRDAANNAPTLRFLGVTIGAIQAQMPPWVRKEVYACDVVYGTNNEFGFDYLRDNLAKSLDEQVQTRRHFAIVDEVDSVLIDEARTPLIISGPAANRKEHYQSANDVAKQLVAGTHFEIDIKDRHATLTESGMDQAAKLFGVPSLWEAETMHLPHFLDNALRANHLFMRDKEYLVANNQVRIIDEHTGRVLEGRRWSDGLHQAVECKEGVPIQEESQTYATITLQNFFRLYDRLAGMTGTAMTEAGEFSAIYKLDVVAIPPNRPVVRRDLQDLIYGSEPEKFDAIVKEVEDLHAAGQPVLVGTISVDVSERLSEFFTRKGIKHNVLNARQHAREAEIVANAGKFGAVTIATNMAGRGTDIILGKTSFAEALAHWKQHGMAPQKLDPDAADLDTAICDLWQRRFLDEVDLKKSKAATPEARLKELNQRRKLNGHYSLPMPSTVKAGVDVRDLGGLRILGTERHDSRRIDNQLRGRSGRQGDPGSTRFYLSLDDDLMKRFANATMAGMMRRMGLKDGIPIESGMVSNAVEKAQKRVEEYYFGIRKNVLEYDQVMNVQRRLIYEQRQRVLTGNDLDGMLRQFYRDAIDDLVQKTAAAGGRGPELAEQLAAAFAEDTGLPKPDPTIIPVKDGGDACRDALMVLVNAAMTTRIAELGEALPHIQRFLLLETIDRRWKDHIYAMDHLRHAIGLEAYAQKDPRIRYKEEGFRRFEMMNGLIRMDVAKMFFRLQVQVQEPAVEELPAGPAAMLAAGGFAAAGAVQEKPKAQPSDPCPCGSGLAFKRCHGK